MPLTVFPTTRLREPVPLLVWAPLAVEAAALRSGAPDLRVERTGMGPVRARRVAAEHDPARALALAVAGVCGSLDADLAAGSVFVPSRVCLPEGGARSADGEGLRAILRERGIEAHGGTLVGSDRIVSEGQRVALRSTGARAVDMESFWLAAAAAGRPFAVLRVVVDAPGAEIRSGKTLVRGCRALGVLRRAAPALREWARSVSLPAPQPPDRR